MILAYYTDCDLNSLVIIVYHELPRINEWFASNKLKINAIKSIIMLFHLCKKIMNTYDNMIKINNTTVALSISTKFFVNHIDNDLIWNAHIMHINKKISKGVCVLF